ncbi:MAG: LacI family DNA-binding transcriptional regulator [Lachnospiraceae bacterium]|nr:LacI family DNA-binding transcriptional regulator [Lachnospiraceae bacterium]
MENRVTIKDIAEELGVSTATVSNVIHGKTKKISQKTVAKVQEKIEESGYLPNMAAVLLAQNTSKIVCIVLSNDAKYENKMIEDPFVSGMLNYLSKELAKNDYFVMLKEVSDVKEIVRYASMWNMAGLVLIGFCAMDYETLRSNMHIPFVVVDSYQKDVHKYSDVGVDNIQGGFLAGSYLIKMGHENIMFLSDNDEDCDHDRYVGLTNALKEAKISVDKKDFKMLSPYKEERVKIYEKLYLERKEYTAAFVASDMYAIEFMNFLLGKGVNIPKDFSIMGFDDIPLASMVYPTLTTVSQNLERRAKVAVELLLELINGESEGRMVLLPVEVVERGSVSENRRRRL